MGHNTGVAQTNPCCNIDFALQNFQTEKGQILQSLLSGGSLYFCIRIDFCPFIFSSNLFVKYKYGDIWKCLVLEATTWVPLLYQHNDCKTTTNTFSDKYKIYRKNICFCLHLFVSFSIFLFSFLFVQVVASWQFLRIF